MKKSYASKKLLNRSRSHEAGVALAIVALVLLLLTLLIIASHYTTISQTASSASFRNNTQAFYVAEAGVQRTIDWFSHQYIPPSPTNPPDWPAMAPAIPTGTPGAGDAIYPNKLINGNSVILSTDPNVASTFPSAAVVNNFQNYLNVAGLNNYTTSATGNLEGQFIVKASLLSTKIITVFLSGPARVERWRVDSVGLWRNGNAATGNVLARAENTAIIETLTTPAVSHVICSNILDFSGGATVDSYDSGMGAYGGANNNGATSIGAYGSSMGPFNRGGVTLVSPGEFDLPNTAGLGCGSPGVICGTNYCPPLPPIPTFTTVTTGAGTNPFMAQPCTLCTTTPAPGMCPMPPSPYVPNCTQCAGAIVNGTIGVPPNASGIYCFWADQLNGDITIDNMTNRTGAGPLNLFINSISLNAKHISVMSNKNNPVNIYISGDMNLIGNAGINFPTSGSQNAQGLNIFASTMGNFTLGSSGGTNISGLVYAPNASSIVSSTGDFYGAIIANSFTKSGATGGIHYDRELGKNILNIAGFVPNTQVRRIY